jgi:hypothetical protein
MQLIVFAGLKIDDKILNFWHNAGKWDDARERRA